MKLNILQAGLHHAGPSLWQLGVAAPARQPGTIRTFGGRRAGAAGVLFHRPLSHEHLALLASLSRSPVHLALHKLVEKGAQDDEIYQATDAMMDAVLAEAKS